MPHIHVVGHRNPDTDSACAAHCYARLKSSLSDGIPYIPAICGSLNAQSAFAFERAGVAPPRVISDVYPRVSDVVRRDGMRLRENDPIFMAVKELDAHTVSVIPVFSDESGFTGIVGIHEITRYFIESGLTERPVYPFRVDNIEEIIPGEILKRGKSEFTAPIMIGAMNVESSLARIDSCPEKPVLIVGKRPDILAHAIARDLPAIILVGVDRESAPDFSSYNGTVFLSRSDTAESARLLRLSVPVRVITNREPITLAHDALFDEAKSTLLNSELRGLPVMENGKFIGVVTRRSFIEKPRPKIILVDHNEVSQSVPGADEADIREIIDHHRLAPAKTSSPIYVFSKPVGSTCTIVHQHYRMRNLKPGKPEALLLLAGILSDTLLLKSPTTTDDDRSSADELSGIAEISIPEFGEEMLSRMTVLRNADPDMVVGSDFKCYREKHISLGIGQVEVMSLDDIDEASPRLFECLEKIRIKHRLDWALLLVTNVVDERSVLLLTEYPDAEKHLAYRKISNRLYDLPGVLSRKKQLLPELLRVSALAAAADTRR